LPGREKYAGRAIGTSMVTDHMTYLLDSNIIIYYLDGNEVIHAFLEENKTHSVISLITYYEVLNFDFSEEEKQIVKEFLESFEILAVSKNIIDRSLKNRNIRKIKMADNFILSTAQLFGLDLVTRNERDFASFSVKIHNPLKEQRP